MVTTPLKSCLMVTTGIAQRENAGLGLNSQEILKKGEGKTTIWKNLDSEIRILKPRE